MMFVLGITGGSGCGKSAVCAELEKRGFYIIDSDKIARQIVSPKMPALSEIEEVFGKEYINSDGSLNRRKLGKLVFADLQMLEKLSDITHKYITESISDKINDCNSGLVLIDAPLLHKAGLENLCNLTVAITAPTLVRLKRIMTRDGVSEQEAKNRINAQLCNEEYSAFCDFTVDNDGNTDISKIADFIYQKVQGECK